MSNRLEMTINEEVFKRFKDFGFNPEEVKRIWLTPQNRLTYSEIKKSVTIWAIMDALE